MTVYLRQSTASQEIALGHFVDSTDGVTAETGLTIANTDIKLFKRGATSLANKNSGGGTHMAGGVYSAVLDATDTDTLGELIIFVAVSGALAVRLECCVLPAMVFDSMILGTDVLQTDVTQFNGTNGTFASGRPEVNTSHIAGSAVSTSSAQIGVNVVNAAGTAWNSGAIGAATLATDTITAAKIAADAIGASELAADAVTEIQSGLATAAALATVDTVVDAIQAKTDNLPSDPADQSLVIAATDAITSALSTVDTVVDAIKVTTDKLDDTLEDDGGTYRFTANALEEGPAGTGGGGGATAEEVWEYATRTLTASPIAVADIADAVWDEDATAHQTQGTFGQAIGDPGATAASIWGLANTNLNATVGSRATQTSVDTIDDFLDTEIAAIKAKTDNLPTDPADASDIAAAFSGVNTKLDTIDDFLDTEIAAIKAKTDALPSDPADASVIATATDAIIAAIGALNDISVADVLTTQMTQSYAANGVAPTLAQALFALHQRMMAFEITGTTLSVKQLNGSTQAFAVTLNDATFPTGSSRP